MRDLRETERGKQKMETSVPSVYPHRLREVQPRQRGTCCYSSVDRQDGGSQGYPVLRGVSARNARLDEDLDDGGFVGGGKLAPAATTDCRFSEKSSGTALSFSSSKVGLQSEAFCAFVGTQVCASSLV